MAVESTVGSPLSEISSFCSRVETDRLTFSPPEVLELLARTVMDVEAQAIPGLFVESGCALGGSALVIARFKKKNRPLRIYDVFSMIPPPSDRDYEDSHNRYAVIKSGKAVGHGGDKYYGYEENLIAKVESTFNTFGLRLLENNISFIKGLYQDTLKISEPVAFGHIDCDWYDSVSICLSQLVPNLALGGSIIVDDYYTFDGCRAAVWDYFRPQLDRFRFDHDKRLIITRVR